MQKDLLFLLVDRLTFRDPWVYKASYHCAEYDSFESGGQLPLELIADVPYLKIAGKCDELFDLDNCENNNQNENCLETFLKINFDTFQNLSWPMENGTWVRF
jgi:hypothetical protein